MCKEELSYQVAKIQQDSNEFAKNLQNSICSIWGLGSSIVSTLESAKSPPQSPLTKRTENLKRRPKNILGSSLNDGAEVIPPLIEKFMIYIEKFRIF